MWKAHISHVKIPMDVAMVRPISGKGLEENSVAMKVGKVDMYCHCVSQCLHVLHN